MSEASSSQRETEEGELNSDEESLLQPTPVKRTTLKCLQQERDATKSFVFTWGILEFDLGFKFGSPFLSTSLGSLHAFAQPAFSTSQYSENMALQNK